MPYATSTDGIRLHYEVTGRRDRPPVLLIQGLGADKHGWDMQRLGLGWSHRFVALDNRGAGRTDKPLGAYSLEQMATDAVSVLDAAGIETAHVVGASMGGGISQLVTLMYPERVRSLTLTCTSCRNHEWRKQLLSGWAEAARTEGMGAMAGEAARWVIGPRSFRRLLPAIGWLGPLGLGRPRHAFANQVEAILAMEEMGDRDLTVELGSINVPTLVVVGNQDILTPRGDSEELAELIPTAELVVISGAAHGLMVEHASTYNRVLKEFLHRAEIAYQDRAAGATAVAAAG